MYSIVQKRGREIRPWVFSANFGALLWRALVIAEISGSCQPLFMRTISVTDAKHDYGTSRRHVKLA